MNMTNQELERMVAWSAPREIVNSRGPRIVRTAIPTPVFWAAWRSEKEAIKALGCSVSLDGPSNSWTITWYQDVPKTSVAPVVTEVVFPPAPVVMPSVPIIVPTSSPKSNDRVWSDEQNAIFNWFKTRQLPTGESVDNLVVRARAGTGKTTTIKVAFTKACEDSMLYAVFNKKNQLEAQSAITDPRVEIKTLHSLGFSYIQQVWSKVKPNDEVESDRVVKAVGENTAREVKLQVRKLVGFAKNMMVAPTVEELVELADARDISTPMFEEEKSGGWTVEALAKAALKVLALSRERDPEGRISFNDMVWLPVAMGWIRAWFDLVVIDESQDMNLPQLLMAKGACKTGGRICVVGDDRQAIYGFRGAASNGMDMMKQSLNAGELSLTTTYRCPKQVVAIASGIVPDYKAAASAPEGIVDHGNENTIYTTVKVGDAILSRANSPLMPICLGLLRKGISARIEGKDIGKALVDIVRKVNAQSVPLFMAKLNNWADKQKARFATSKHFEEKSIEINDQVDTLIAVAEGASSVAEIERRLVTLFSDTEADGRPSVILSSVHKAKGLEWEHVFLLVDTFRSSKPFNGEPESPEAAALRVREAANVYYVALTRAKQHLSMISTRR